MAGVWLPAPVNGGPAHNFSEETSGTAIVTENPAALVAAAGSNGVGGDETAIKKTSTV